VTSYVAAGALWCQVGRADGVSDGVNLLELKPLVSPIRDRSDFDILFVTPLDWGARV